ncbi:MAG: SurA N-terminal domain-containing protein, partial [Spirochaetales bacterium]|nr:SurA N-terminal domain-containing protein [Spirochaetales bacterium]
MNKAQMARVLVLVAVGSALGFAGCAREGAGGPVVATVNGRPIYAASLDLEMVRYEQLLLAGGDAEGSADPVRMARLRAEALEKLIDTELLYQEALRTGHEASKEAVEEQLSSLKGQFESEEAFETALGELGIEQTELRRDLERGLVIQEFVEEDIRPTVTVTPEDARAYYDTHPEQFTEPERVRARHIL